MADSFEAHSSLPPEVLKHYARGKSLRNIKPPDCTCVEDSDIIGLPGL